MEEARNELAMAGAALLNPRVNRQKADPSQGHSALGSPQHEGRRPEHAAAAAATLDGRQGGRFYERKGLITRPYRPA